MKKVAAVVVVSLCCWLVASAGLAKCLKGRKATVTIEVDFSTDIPTIDFGSKGADPIPCVYRNGEIEVTVNFTDKPNNQELKLSNFRALVFAHPASAQGGSWISDFDDLDHLEITEDAGGDNWQPIASQKLVFQASGFRTIKLQGQRPPGTPGGPHRLISYRLELAKDGTGGGNVTEIVFDPPWGERP